MSTPLSDRLAVCSWSLRPESPAELAGHLRTIGILRTQLAIDPIRLGGEWADGIREAQRPRHHRRERRCSRPSARTTRRSIRSDRPVASSLTRRGRRRSTTSGAWRRWSSRAGLDHVTFHAGFLPHETHRPELSEAGEPARPGRRPLRRPRPDVLSRDRPGRRRVTSELSRRRSTARTSASTSIRPI